MDVERERRILHLLEMALKTTLNQQKTMMRQLKREDQDLWGEMKILLETETRGAPLLDAPLLDSADDRDQPPTSRELRGYEIQREIGRGGMGVVYLAQHPGKGPAAVKILKRGMDTDDFIRRFRNEHHILANLKHPNIAGLRHSGVTDDGRPFLVLEYVEGAPLHQWSRSGPGVRERLELFLKICRSVHYAHRRGVVHRDLKPGNIMVTPRGEPVLLDFGIAKMLERNETQAPTVTVTSRRVLTPAYASPEHIKGCYPAPASDVWSLGVLLFELLTGDFPYGSGGCSAEEVLRRIREEKPQTVRGAFRKNTNPTTRPGVRARDLTRPIDRIVGKALAGDVGRRYGSAAALADDVDRYLNGEPVLAGRGAWDRWSRGRRLCWAALVSAVLWTAALLARASI